MKKLLLAAGLLALTALPALAQTAPDADVVVLRIEHASNGRLIVSTSSGANSTQARLVPLDFNTVKAVSTITETTQQELAALLKQGYTLKSVSGGDNITLMILTKQK